MSLWIIAISLVYLFIIRLRFPASKSTVIFSERLGVRLAELGRSTFSLHNKYFCTNQCHYIGLARDGDGQGGMSQGWGSNQGWTLKLKPANFNNNKPY